MLTGKYLDGIPEGSRAARDSSLSPDLLTEKNLEHVRALNAIAGERGQSLAQMALAWALRDERVTTVLIGASSVAQLDDNLARPGQPALRRRRAQPASTSTPSTPGSTCGRAPARPDTVDRKASVAIRRCPAPLGRPTVTPGDRDEQRRSKIVQTAIVLQGGGALGAYEYGVLRALYEQRPGFRPVAVAGRVDRGDHRRGARRGEGRPDRGPRRRCGGAKLTRRPRRWGCPPAVDRSLALLGNPGMYQLHAGLFTAPWLLTSFYDTAPLRATLAELVDPARLNADDPRVIVGATNVGTGEMEFFDRDRPGGLTFEHVAASGSLPPSFPMTEHRTEQQYWDGGLFSNTPLEPRDRRAGAGGGRRPRRGARADRRRAVPDAGGGAADHAGRRCSGWSSCSTRAG